MHRRNGRLSIKPHGRRPSKPGGSDSSPILVGFDDRVDVGIVGIFSRKDLLHLGHAPGASSDDRLGPLSDRLALLAPVLLVRTPDALVLEPERHEAQGRDLEPRRNDLAREIGMACIPPLLARPHDNDLGRDHCPEPGRP
jgi:hypothetical protein